MRFAAALAFVACSLGLSFAPQTRAQSYGFSTPAGVAGSPGKADGTNNVARLSSPRAVAVDAGGNCFVADADNHVIRKLTRSGANWVLTTIAGSPGVSGTADGSNSVARFYFPYGITADAAGNLYVADTYNQTIRKLTPYGTNWAVTTLAGDPGVGGSNDGTGTDARFAHPTAVAADSSGNVFVADTDNHIVRQVTPAGAVTTPAGFAGAVGIADGTNNLARFYFPSGLAVSGGNVFVADTYNHTIRELSPVAGDWVVRTIAGLPTFYGSDDGTNRFAFFNYPRGVATDSTGNLFIADTLNNTIRRLSAQGTNWVSATVAGLPGVPGSQDGIGQTALFNSPYDVAVDAAGNLFVADTANDTLRFGRFGFSLQTALAGGQMILSWSSQAASYSLETSASLASGAAWTRLDTGIFLSGTNFVRTNTVGAGPAFFRLRKN